MKQEVAEFYPRNRKEWRAWLEANHKTAKSIWLVLYKKNSGMPSVEIGEAIDEAICFGWIDSKVNGRDEKSYKQYFAPRNPKSNWSRVNKNKVQRLMDEGIMAEAGYEMIAHAKGIGTWDALNDVEDLVVDPDLAAAFDKHPGSREYWEDFPRSVKRGILEWIFNAKRPATRAKRIEETASLAAQNIRANQWKR